jgi:hypothetical protein
LFVAGIPAHLSQLASVSNIRQTWIQLKPGDEQALLNLGLSIHFYTAYLVALEVAVVAVFAATSVLIFWRRSDDGMAIFASLASILFGATSVSTIQAFVATHPAWHLPVDVLNAIGLGSGLLLFYLFPDGHFFPRWTRWLGISWVVWVLSWPFVPALNADRWAYPWPILIRLLWYGTGVFAQIYRYRRYSTRVDQQRTKWVVFGFTAAVVGFFLFNLPIILYEELNYPLYIIVAYPLLALVPMLLAPLSLVFASLRYRLWDIDIIINRTLIYGVLTAALALGYVISIVLLQSVLRLLTGHEESEIVTAVSTLGIAAAFQPVRRLVQSFIDRRFFHRKYDAEKTLAAFSATVRDEVDLGRLTDDLLAVIEETMKPAHVSLWLLPTPAKEAHPPTDAQKPNSNP